MTEYIERDKALENVISAGLCDAQGNMYGADDVVLADDIKAIPAADVAPVVHGKWSDNGYGLCFCSVCGYPPSYIPTHCFASSFCPKCGAKMDIK